MYGYYNMAAREVSLSWSGKGEDHWGLVRKIGPWKTTPIDRHFSQSGGINPGHANAFTSYNPGGFDSSIPPTMQQRYKSGDVVYNTLEYETNHYEKHLFGYPSKRIVMGRNTFEGIGTLGVKTVGPPSFGAFGSGTQVYREGGREQPMETDSKAFPPRYMSRPTSLMEIDAMTPPHMVGRTENPQNFTPSPLAEDFKVEIIKPETSTTSYTQLADKVKQEAVQTAQSVGYKQPVMPGSYPAELPSVRPTRNSGKQGVVSTPYSRPAKSKPVIKEDTYDAALQGALQDKMSRLGQTKRKALNQGGTKKAARTGEQTNALKRATDSTQAGSRKKQNTAVLLRGGATKSTLGKRATDATQAGVRKRQNITASMTREGPTTRKSKLSVNTSVKGSGPKATKKVGVKMDSLIPTRSSTRNVKNRK